MPAAATTKQRPPASVAEEGMTPKKTALIIVTVIGCIAILWPKVFHPMMFGGVAPPKQNFKDQRAAPGGLRQERPAHLHPESIYQAMRERGRAIPATPTVPIVERKSSPSNPPPRIVDGRPGPIPGMRPPMGAGALHQPQQRGSSMGFLMPLYTIGIVVFFGYTIMKIVFKKQIPNSPYGPAPSDPSFRQEVFGQQKHSQVEDLAGSKLVVTAIQGLIDAADEQLNGPDKLRATSDTESDLNKQNDNNETKEDPSETKQNLSNGHLKSNQDPDQEAKGAVAGAGAGQQRKRRTPSAERELTSKLENLPEPQSIYLEGALAHDSQILVADSQIKREEVYDSELNGSAEEPAVILSSRMTLSLINLDANQQNGNVGKTEVESPLADDIEIIGHDEK
ncbi:resistance to inhibitors of cholinesterase protein 3 isoform X9 [Drosophila bipectinata]|uniref:resistance to inhibitors of cholinesterase protein 3 isoform X9 n=1 Tax=Drosophila bipectinata TaxID=42026 RepID=UPI001C88E481|nr:resistance to inhibitors of cholinesterase protein 3 isoform X12 [Drosophila bipectinata]